MTAATRNLSRLVCLAALGLVAVAVLAPKPAAAEVGPLPRLVSLSDTYAEPGGTYEFGLMVQNHGDEEIPQAGLTVTATLPPGMTGVEARSSNPGFICPDATGLTEITCEAALPLQPDIEEALFFTATVPNEEGIKTASFSLASSVGTAQTVDSVRLKPGTPPPGIDSVDGLISADPAETPDTLAGSHPYGFTLNWDVNTWTNPNPVFGPRDPVADVREVVAELPPGFVGNPTNLEHCTLAELVGVGEGGSTPLCPPGSQAGMVTVKVSAPGALLFTLPVYVLEPPRGVAARFGFSIVGTTIIIDNTVRAGSDYGLTVHSDNIPQPLQIVGNTNTIWGVPGDESHRFERNCPEGGNAANGGQTCPGGPEKAFFREPTSCSAEGLQFGFGARFWQGSGELSHSEFRTHSGPGYPYPTEDWGPEVGVEGCEDVPFEPTVSVQPTVPKADSPTGLETDISVPQSCWETNEVDSICQSDLKDTVLKLPPGMTINPASASGLEACTAAQVGYKPGTSAPFEFSDQPVNCPDSSKIGSAEVHSPLVDHPLPGAVYLAKQGDNPLGSLLALYLVIEDPQSGTIIKQAARVVANEQTGQLETVFEEAPQLPFEDLKVDLFGGPRAALRTPPSCGTYTTQAALTPWARPDSPVDLTSSFQITQGCGAGFNPKLDAGTANPLAGKTSPLSLRVTREDTEAELGSLTATLPAGLYGYLAGIPYCPDSALAAVSAAEGTGLAQEATPSCPAASRLGTVTVGAGAGANPFFTSSGRAYLAGPYKGAPLSLAVVTPAVAGPFDLGSVVVRNALRIDPETTQVTAVSDPLPQILHGIPLDLRDVRVALDRKNFTFNPTNCEEMAITSRISSIGGATASPSQRFQVAGCEDLAFKPKLTFKLKGKTRRGGNPALTAILTARPGDANIGKVIVAFPHSEFLDQGHLRNVCTRVQFNSGAGNGVDCPAGSIYGHVTATSPIVGYALEGNVYLRSTPEHELPDLVLALSGPASQPVAVSTVGRIDSVKGGIRSSFEAVPDVPLTKVVLRMGGGKKSLLQNSTNICKRTHKVDVRMDGQNGKFSDSTPTLKVAGCKKTHKHRRGRR